MDTKILPLTNQDIEEVVDVHMRAFPDFFLTFLGPGFLKEFYKSFLYDDQGIGFVAIENSRILGAIGRLILRYNDILKYSKKLEPIKCDSRRQCCGDSNCYFK